MDTPANWRNVLPVFKKHSKDTPDNCRLSSLTSIPGKNMNQVLLDHISGHMEET